MAPVQQILIAGNSFSALLVAAILASNLKRVEIRLLEAVEPIVGSPAESSASNINAILNLLGINKSEFIINTHATIKLGNQFIDWNADAPDFVHAFDAYGSKLCGDELPQVIFGLDRQHLKYIDTLSVAATAARSGRLFPGGNCSAHQRPGIAHGLHFNSDEFARFLLGYLQHLGVKRTSELLAHVAMTDDGSIAYLQTVSGAKYHADLYIDCTGTQALLHGCAMGVEYLDWSSLLKMDSSFIAFRDAENMVNAGLLTRIQKAKTGVARSIPLRNMTVVEFFYSSQLTSAESAKAEFAELMSAGKEKLSPCIQFKPGRRVSFWKKNCVAMGDAGANLGLGIYSSMFTTLAAAIRLLDYFPSKTIAQPLIDEYNRTTINEMECLRDYHALHYFLLDESDPLKLRDIEKLLPSLAAKLQVFSVSGRLPWLDDEVAAKMQWESLLIGLGHWPQRCNPLLDPASISGLKSAAVTMQQTIARYVSTLPTHAEYLSQFTSSKK